MSDYSSTPPPGWICKDGVCMPDPAYSPAAAAHSKLDIDIVVDIVCPFCMLGYRRLQRALAALDAGKVAVTINWLPFQLDPTLPSPGYPKTEHYLRKFGPGFTARMQSMVEAGKGEGINFSFNGRVGNTMNSHRLVQWSKQFGKQDALINALFHAYFENEKDISELDVLCSLACDAGLDGAAARAFLLTDELRAQVVESIEESARNEIHGVPHFHISATNAEGEKKQIDISGAQEPHRFVNIFKDWKLM